MLWIIGGWGNRPDSLESAVGRLQRSLSRIPDESGKYGPWGYWQRRQARAGFIDRPQPHNHIAFNVDDDTDDSAVMGYMSALVEVWRPDHLGALTMRTWRAQGRKAPGPVVGRLTYVRDGTPLNANALGGEVDVAEAAGGRYIRVPGTPTDLSLEHIRQVRKALGYADV
ncbi:hypothetical protein [Mycolicibacterium septicum]|uniref:hypothetical protein n=1 Tax=Mycolicibacterium septicum TaxID=98668 RepID=UPI001AFADF66|nr:hypothetical protein [Mycolicibacterium septicum]QRY54511.1 hypothetical protein JVX95_15030 [Mycolicibacterium septicum]